MKSEWSIKIIMLGILSCMSSISFGGNKTSDSLLIQRMYDYRRNFAAEVCDSTRNIYVKYDVDVQKFFNFFYTLFLGVGGDNGYIPVVIIFHI